MRTPAALLVLCVIGVLTAAAPGLVLAADGKQPDALTDKAATLYDEGAAAYKRSSWAEARASFLAAWALKQHWQIAGSLGDCELRLGLHREAAEHMAYFLRNAPPERRTADAKKLYEQARSSLGTLTIDVDAKGADVFVDGKLVSSSPLEGPVFVEPGHHVVEARLSDGLGTEKIDIVRGAERSVKLSVKKRELPQPDPAPRSMVPGVVLAGVGGAALAAGIGLMIDAHGKYVTSELLSEAIRAGAHNCVVGSSSFDSRCDELHTTAAAVNTRNGAGIGLVVGGGAMAAAALTYFLWPEAARPPSAGVVRVTPLVSTTGVTMSLSGSF